MRRSLLFIPGNNPAMLQTADVFESDAIILDLEDAVHINEKDSARNLVSQFLDSFIPFKGEIVIRINGFDSPYFYDDLHAIVSDQIDTIMLPKANQHSLIALDKELSILEADKKMNKIIGIIPIIELASSVLEVDSLVHLNRINGVLLGAEDLSTDLGIERTKEGKEILYPRSRVIYACAAKRIDAIDTPFTDTRDEMGLKSDCENAKSLGMNAKTAIHPNQVEVINQCFSPSLKNIDWAKRILEAKKRSEANGLGVFSLDGKMVDKPIIDRAEKILIQAEKFRLL
jgi:citrate lyase subunit beta/citryl-CoA lyase